MRSFIFVLFVLLCFCEKQAPLLKKSNTTALGKDISLEITARLIKFEQMEKKFKVLAVIEEETSIKVFAVGDTVSLYPNFIRQEGATINMKSAVNKKMTKLQYLEPGSVINATIKLKGSGKKRHGLIMDWSEQ